MDELLTKIPSSVYVAVWSLLLANIGTIVTILYGIGRLVWWASSVESRLKDHTKDINAAFEKIRALEQKP